MSEPQYHLIGYSNVPYFMLQVDRVLTSLMQHGFSNMARVGDLRAVKCSLLPYSVYHKGGSNEQLKKLKVEVLCHLG